MTTKVPPPTLSRPVERTFAPPLSHERAECIAKWATLFFLLSLAAIPTLYYFQVTQYLPIPSATAFLSFITLILTTYCKTTCGELCSKESTLQTALNTPIARSPIDRSMSTWLREKPKERIGAFVQFSDFRPPYNSLTPIVLLKSKEKRADVEKASAILRPLVEAISQTNCMNLKTALWNLCVTQAGALTPYGEALRATQFRHIYIENPTDEEDELGIYCRVTIGPRGIVLSQGLLASELMALRTFFPNLALTPPAQITPIDEAEIQKSHEVNRRTILTKEKTRNQL